MHFPSTIYQNPVIPNGYYWMQLVNVITEPCGMERPRLWVQVEIGNCPMHPETTGLLLCAIIHPVERADFIYENFLRAFRIQGCDFKAAIGRWASCRIETAEYQGTQYSSVRFPRQSPVAQEDALKLERLEAEGRLDEASWKGDR